MQENIHFSSKTNEWATPQYLFDKLNKEHQFTMDACANQDNKKCKMFYNQEENGLIQPWLGVVWCNPPYSNVKEWIKKAYEESLKGVKVVMLIPARTDTIAWHTWIFPFAKIEFIKGRLKFGDSKNSAPFPSAIVIFGDK